jgi:hypothetical protein
MRLALIENIDDGRGNFNAIKLEYDLDVHRERLTNIAMEYYLGNKYKLKRKYYKIDENSLESMLRESFDYAFRILEQELKKQTVRLL